MNGDLLKAGIIKQIFKPVIKSDLPGRLRLGILNYALIPAGVTQVATQYVGKAFCLLPGITSAELNPLLGTLLIQYNPRLASKQTILNWIETMIELGLDGIPKLQKAGVKDPLQIEAYFTERLQKCLQRE